MDLQTSKCVRHHHGFCLGGMCLHCFVYAGELLGISAVFQCFAAWAAHHLGQNSNMLFQLVRNSEMTFVKLAERRGGQCRSRVFLGELFTIFCNWGLVTLIRTDYVTIFIWFYICCLCMLMLTMLSPGRKLDNCRCYVLQSNLPHVFLRKSQYLSGCLEWARTGEAYCFRTIQILRAKLWVLALQCLFAEVTVQIRSQSTQSTWVLLSLGGLLTFLKSKVGPCGSTDWDIWLYFGKSHCTCKWSGSWSSKVRSRNGFTKPIWTHLDANTVASESVGPRCQSQSCCNARSKSFKSQNQSSAYGSCLKPVGECSLLRNTSLYSSIVRKDDIERQSAVLSGYMWLSKGFHWMKDPNFKPLFPRSCCLDANTFWPRIYGHLHDYLRSLSTLAANFAFFNACSSVKVQQHTINTVYDRIQSYTIMYNDV